jgi:signal transduction histidine kinase
VTQDTPAGNVTPAAFSPSAAQARLVRVRAEQVKALYSQLPRSTSAMSVGALILVAAMWPVVSHMVLLAWLGLVVLNQTWRLYLWRAFKPASSSTELMRHWGVYWTIGAGISGSLWGACAFLMYVPESHAYQAFLVTVMLAVTTGAVILIAVHLPSLYAFVLPTLLPLIARLMLDPQALSMFLAVALSVLFAVMLAFGHNLNALFTRSLHQRFENMELIEELTQQKALAEDAQRRAEAATRAKSVFLAAASHDLRQPLHAVGFFAAALSGRVSDPEVRDLINSINASVEALENLFNALLDISKLDAGVVEPSVNAFSLEAMLTRLKQEFEPAAFDAGLQLRVRTRQLRVYTDPVLLERILRNLISNAIRYTRRGGVLVGCRVRGRVVGIEVWDTGVGIAQTEHERIFEEFYQIHDESSPREQGLGLGLGLAITRRLCDLLGHPLVLRSRVGRGTMFGLEVPRARGDTMEAQESGVLGQLEDALRGRRVVVIEDEEPVLRGTEALLASWGCEPIGARSTGEALDRVHDREGIDLVIADYRLEGGRTGIESIQALREQFGATVPAILVTGSTDPDLAIQADRGGFHLLHKPVMPAKLRSLVTFKLKSAREAVIRDS